MDIKFMLTTFGLVFLAELGDKTQLATFCLSADCESSKLSVFIGSAGALVLSSLIAVLFGDAISRVVSPSWIRIGAGFFFVVVGVWMLATATKAVCNL
jgi:putative Ca2+/H+ antiporter (TMEM165/GDT1 family)